MNIHLHNLVTLDRPTILLESVGALNQDLYVQDSNKDIDDDKLIQQIDFFTSHQFNPSQSDAFILADTLISYIHLKMKKRICLMRKIIEESWNGLESVKQIEKLESSVLIYLKQLLNVLKQAMRFMDAKQFNYTLNDLNGLEVLFLYSDNLELIYYAFQFVYLMNERELANNDRIFGTIRNMKIYNTIGHLYIHFLKYDREQYPYIIELYRTDKFFKDVSTACHSLFPLSWTRAPPFQRHAAHDNSPAVPFRAARWLAITRTNSHPLVLCALLLRSGTGLL